MSGGVRRGLFLSAAPFLGGFLLWGMLGLPGFGRYPGPYGDVLNRVAIRERHVTNVTTSVNFDYRGLDTMGEEFILFVSLAGLSLLLRTQRGEAEEGAPDCASGRAVFPRSDAVRWLGLGLTGVTNLLGLYIVLHGQLTPGGGFQGGAILGTAAMLAYLAAGYRAFRQVSPKFLVELTEAAGAGGYVMVGLMALLLGGAFLENILPLGKTGSLLSSGTIALINALVGLEVSAGFVLLFTEFLQETRKRKE